MQPLALQRCSWHIDSACTVQTDILCLKLFETYSSTIYNSILCCNTIHIALPVPLAKLLGLHATHLGAFHNAVLLHAHAHVHAAAGHGSVQLLPAAARLHRHEGREGGSLLHSSEGKLGGQVVQRRALAAHFSAGTIRGC